MACGCSKTSLSGVHVLSGSGTNYDGEYPSEIEAMAAKIRAGGSGTVKAK